MYPVGSGGDVGTQSEIPFLETEYRVRTAAPVSHPCTTSMRLYPLLVGPDSHKHAYPTVGPAMQFYSALPEPITRATS